MRGTLRSRAKGSWTLQWYTGRDSTTGKPAYSSETFHGNKRDAQTRLSEIITDIQRGEHVNPSAVPLRLFLLDWLAAIEPTVAAKTHERYGELVKLHVIPALGHHTLKGLRPRHIQQFYSACLLTGRRQAVEGKPGLSPRTVLHLHRVLRRALQTALRWQLVPRNPCDAVDPPKVEDAEMRIFTRDEINRILAAAAGSIWYMPCLLALYTGMRRGEILALRWTDVDIESGVVYVRRSLSQTAKGLAFKQPKSGRGRQIDVPQDLTEALQKHRISQAEERKGAATVTNVDNGDLVCCYEDGRPIVPDGFSTRFVGLLTRAGVDRVPFHAFRHTHASELLTQGVHPKVVQERLGHASIAITMNRYSHVVPSIQKAAADRIPGYLDEL